jgi:hypothetical protein
MHVVPSGLIVTEIGAQVYAFNGSSMFLFGGVGGFLFRPTGQVRKCRPTSGFFTFRQTLMPVASRAVSRLKPLIMSLVTGALPCCTPDSFNM